MSQAMKASIFRLVVRNLSENIYPYEVLKNVYQFSMNIRSIRLYHLFVFYGKTSHHS